MSREIKFRAWDLSTEEIITAGDERRWGSVTNHYLFRNYEDQYLMQYTGLKDKNGTEIYEGDVIDLTYWWFDGSERESHLIGSIGFEPTTFTLENIHNDFFQEETGFDKGEGILSLGEFMIAESDVEILGNKFENPELLEVEYE